MPLWSKKSHQNLKPYEGSGSLGLGPDTATEIPPHSAAQYDPGVNQPVPDPTVEEQWRQLSHFRLTDDMTGEDWERERIRRSKRKENVRNAAENEPSQTPFKEKARNEVYYQPPPNPRNPGRPGLYTFTREWYYHTKERLFNGNHFSMATHARNYDIFGMTPSHPDKRNTYRAEPPPRDVFVENRGEDNYSPPYAMEAVPETSPPPRPNYRL